MMANVDYDEVAPTYDRRYLRGGPRDLVAFVRSFLSQLEGRSVLECGCGTGRWLAEAVGCARVVIGLDSSSGMLARARSKVSAADLVQGRAEGLPFPDRSFSGVLCVNAVHHFERPEHFVRESARVLAPGGRVAIVAMAPHDGGDSWYLYDYFERTRETDCRRYPSITLVRDWLGAAEFEHIETGIAASIRSSVSGKAVLDDPVLSRHGTSQLSLLTNEEYEQGMQRIRSALASTVQPPPVFQVDLRLFGTMAVKPKGSR